MNNNYQDETPESTVIIEKILDQEVKLRKLKDENAEKSTLDEEEKILLQLKSDYKSQTGKDWILEPNDHSSAANGDEKLANEDEQLENEEAPTNSDQAGDVSFKIQVLLNKIRKMDVNDSESITAEYSHVLELKETYKKLTGSEWTSTSMKEFTKNPKLRDSQFQKKKIPKEEYDDKKDSHLGLEALKGENLAEWYSQVITKGELIEYYNVSGCYILRPWAIFIWEVIKNYIDKAIANLGVQNCLFPLLISKSVLEKERAHVVNFAPEVAWITNAGGNKLSEPIAIRPTSETAMYPFYSKWLQSYRDLPIKLNQWNNVVRWEFKNAQPFIRSREFLWQEGHTAFAQQSEADDELYKILDLYEKVYSDLLAIPVIKGRKSEKEKFPGSEFTTTIEALIPTNGKAIQGATAHYLGQNFAKMFDIAYEDPKSQKRKYVYQNCWGLTTRAIGIMVLTHSDNKGLVLPPPVAFYQAVIVPCGKVKGSVKERVDIECKRAEKKLITSGVRVYGDFRDNCTPGWKFHHWELKGVPVRIEIGPAELQTGTAILVRRDTGDKFTVSGKDIVFKVKSLLERIHKLMLQKAQTNLKEYTTLTTDWNEFINNLNQKCILLSPFCGSVPCENKIRENSTKEETDKKNGDGMGAKSLCTPFKQPRQLKPDDKCINPNCTNKPSAFTYFGRSY